MRGGDFAELRAFAAVAEHGSFARAARQLGVSPSALSQTIRSLEERLGVRLLNRTTRSVAPSQAGERFLVRLRPAMADLDLAVEDVMALRDSPSGLLRINASRLAAIYYLGPLLGPFLQAYPDITVDLVADDRLIDIVAGQFDAGVRLGEKVERDMVAVRLSRDLELMAVASPAYVAQHGAPSTPRELRDHQCINIRWPTDQSLYHWEFERGDEQIEVAVQGSLTVNESDVALAAAVSGAGIAYLADHHVRQALTNGLVVRVLEDWSPPFPGFYLYYPSRRQTPPPLRAFIDFVVKLDRT